MSQNSSSIFSPFLTLTRNSSQKDIKQSFSETTKKYKFWYSNLNFFSFLFVIRAFCLYSWLFVCLSRLFVYIGKLFVYIIQFFVYICEHFISFSQLFEECLKNQIPVGCRAYKTRAKSVTKFSIEIPEFSAEFRCSSRYPKRVSSNGQIVMAGKLISSMLFCITEVTTGCSSHAEKLFLMIQVAKKIPNMTKN